MTDEYVPLITQLRRAAKTSLTPIPAGFAMCSAAANAIERLQRERDRAELTACFTVEDLEAELRHCWAFMSWLDGALVDRDWPAIPEAVQRLKAALRPVSALDGSAAVSVPHSDHTEQTEEQ